MSKLIPAALLASGAAIALKKLKVNPFKLSYPVDTVYDNGVALAPPMGWSSWNTFRNRINEDIIYETGKALKDSGLADCGYVYLNIDDCWQSSMRDSAGKLQSDFVSFPNGIKNLCERVNALGLKLGIYSSNGTLTCEELPASLGNEALDADTFAEWGIEYFKYDFCHNVPIPSRAPKIEKITVSRIGSSEDIVYLASDAVLSGDAKLVTESALTTGMYIDGLSSNGGSCEFNNIIADEDGEYILTFCVFKKSNSNKYLEIIVNDTDCYNTVFPPSKGFTPEGRHQVIIKLKKGINTLKLYNPIASRQDSTAIQYTNMGNELRRATKEYAKKNNCPEKPIVYSICEWGKNFPWRWGRKAGNLWRTTPDIRPSWASVVGIYEFNVLLYRYAGAGSWNDPDMLEVGNGSLSYEENKSHFTLWCMMAAPLILGNDIRKFIKADGTVDDENPSYKIVSNKELIAVDQDSLGVQCRRIRTNGAEDILLKPLENDDFAVCFFNKASSPSRMEVSFSEIISKPFIATESSEEYICRDLWSGKEKTVSNKIEASVPAHGIRIFRVRVK
ncbi:MAG: alpha-galactosidase [Clostridia bacterium]|nr:alpha-galactosidase [Clostridia bacterium]